MTASQAIAELRQAYGHLDGADLLAAMRWKFGAGLAVTSSFGVEAAILLDLVAQVDKTIPVIFLDTGELFDETLAYQRELSSLLGLADLRVIRPSPVELAEAEDLWRTDPDSCCRLRKVLPLDRAVAGFRALVDGRKRMHGAGREAVQTIEAGANGVVKIAPLAGWTSVRIERYFDDRGLPRHPLAVQGYRSVGCWPCSRPTGADESPRAGRWSGMAKTECGIHRVIKHP